MLKIKFKKGTLKKFLFYVMKTLHIFPRLVDIAAYILLKYS